MTRVAVRRGGHQHELGAERAERVLLLDRLRVGHDDDDVVAARVGDDRQPDAGVAGGALDNNAARPQHAAGFRIEDDEQCGAVLDRSAGVHELALGEDLAPGALRRPAQAEQWRVADQRDDVGGGCIHAPQR